MGKGISIGVASDTREFSKGVKDGVIKPLEGASDALDDVAKDGTKAGKKLEDAMDDARKETSDFKKEQSELGKAMARASEEGGSAMKRNTKDATSSAKRDLETLGDEAKANAAETFSSFDGSVESFGDMIQGTLGGIVSDMGPMGAALGAAGAVGVGLIMAAMGDAATATEEVKARTADLATEYITTGNLGAESIEYLVGKLQDLATESDGINLAKLAKTAKESGSSFKDLAQAYAGNSKGLKELWRDGDKYLKQLQDEADAADTSTSAGAAQYAQKIKQADAQRTYMDYLGQSLGIAKEAAAAEENYARAGGPELEAKAAAIESVQSSIDDAAGSWEDYQDAESGAVDPAAYLAGLQKRLAAANNYAANLAAAQQQLSPEAYQYLVDQGIDFAPMLSSILSSGLVDQFNTTFTQAANAGNAAIDSTLTTDAEVTVTASVVTPERDLNRLANTKRATAIDAKATTATAERDLNRIANQTRTATITANAQVSAAERALDKLVREARTVTIVARVVDRAGKAIQ